MSAFSLISRRWPALAVATVLAACGGGGHDDATMPTGHATAYAVRAVVSDTNAAANPYASSNVDAHLVNGWGIAFNPQGFVWVANNGTSTSTLYDGNGVPQSLVVSIPAGSAGNAAPTGIVFNAGTGFVVTQGGLSGASAFLFAGESGTIAGWSPAVDRNNAITAVDRGASSAVYKGLAIGSQGSGSVLYASDFHHATVDVFDATFAPVTTAGAFTDPSLPTGFAPFGIQVIGGLVYVSYAKQDAQAQDEEAGAGLGAVDVFDAAGTLVKRLIPAGGALNAPWGMAIAPAGFGPFSNALLVGNFGDGRINAFDASSGALLGTLSAADGKPIAIDGLWGIAFGNGLNAQPANTLFFAAGPAGESHGAYGRIDLQ